MKLETHKEEILLLEFNCEALQGSNSGNCMKDILKKSDFSHHGTIKINQ